MAKPLYRAMKAAPDGPECGPAANRLGARVPAEPPPPQVDVVPDDDGIVHPGTGGMSVFSTIRAIPISRLPTTHGGYNKKDLLVVIDEAAVVDPLAHRPDHGAHGTIQPLEAMHVDEYQRALCQTKPTWEVA